MQKVDWLEVLEIALTSVAFGTFGRKIFKGSMMQNIGVR